MPKPETQPASPTSTGQRPGQSPHARPGRDWPSLLPWLLALCGVLVYLNTLPNQFVFDTTRLVRPQTIERLADPVHLLSGWRRAIPRATLVLNFAIDGIKPAGYHIANLLIHVLAGMTLYGLARRTMLFMRKPDRSGIAAPWIAAAIALVWLVHPLNTQAVSYVVQRTESLMALFYLLSLYALVRYAEGDTDGRWGVASVAAFVAALMCKEVAVTLPLVALLYDRALLGGSFKASLRARWPMYAVMFGLWGVGIVVLLPPALDPSGAAGFGMANITSTEYLVSQAGVILHYLRLSVLPYPLVIDYWWPVAEAWWQWLPQLVVVTALLIGVIWGLWRNTWWGMLGAAFFLILSPTSSIMPIADLAVEHRMYLPLTVVVALAVVLACAGLMRKAADRKQQAQIGGVLVALVALALGLGTVLRNFDYRTPIVLWQTVVERAPSNPRGYQKLGEAYQHLAKDYREEGRPSEVQDTLALAVHNYNESIELQRRLSEQGRRVPPSSVHAFNNLSEVRTEQAQAMREQGRSQTANEYFEQARRLITAAIQIAPNEAEFHYNLGRLELLRGNLETAERALRRALDLRSGYAKAHNNLGVVYMRQGKRDAAEKMFRTALRHDRAYGAAYRNLGNALAERGRLRKAISAYETAIQLGDRDVSVRVSLGQAYARMGEWSSARHQLQTAVRRDASHVPANMLLGRVCEHIGDAVTAVKAYEDAREQRPDWPPPVAKIALMRTTHPSDEFRRPEYAAEILEPFKERAEDNHELLEAFAALHAERGEFDQAVKQQQRAIELVQQADQPDAALEKMRDRLETYQQGEPYRDPVYEQRREERYF